MPNMTEKDYAKYVVDNIGRASAPNALKITDTLISNYTIELFLMELEYYVKSLLDTNKISEVNVCKIIVASDKLRNKLTSGYNYNKTMAIDVFVLELWEIFS